MVKIIAEYVWSDQALIALWQRGRQILGGVRMFDKAAEPDDDTKTEIMKTMAGIINGLDQTSFDNPIIVMNGIDPEITKMLHAQRN